QFPVVVVRAFGEVNDHWEETLGPNTEYKRKSRAEASQALGQGCFNQLLQTAPPHAGTAAAQ
ncbi:MAG TPA: hypothetical protein VJQ54_00155, partial [Candidatus Sulfotelmatobacter sp.]|nr:hypothetical protein [Candidatus Sulfotelmatobacter sp.]